MIRGNFARNDSLRFYTPAYLIILLFACILSLCVCVFLSVTVYVCVIVCDFMCCLVDVINDN